MQKNLLFYNFFDKKNCSFFITKSYWLKKNVRWINLKSFNIVLILRQNIMLIFE